MRDRIGETARERLMASSYLALRGIDCTGRDGVLTLRGCVPSHHQRQLALAVVAGIEGVREYVDQIRVGAASRSPIIGDEGCRQAPAG